MTTLSRTVLYPRHVELGAQMVDFGGWDMPVQYPDGILKEHLATRRTAGLFDVSHMGRFIVSGTGALDFLQHVLTNHARALDVGESQYTLIPDQTGGAVDDAYLYRFFQDRYLLVVNAANREKDWAHLQNELPHFEGVQLEDQTAEIAMISLQGPQAKAILSQLVGEEALPEPRRNCLSIAAMIGPLALAGTHRLHRRAAVFRGVHAGGQRHFRLGCHAGQRRDAHRAGRQGYPPPGGGAPALRPRAGRQIPKAPRFPFLPFPWPVSRSASLRTKKTISVERH
jgi:hypothetical protein